MLSAHCVRQEAEEYPSTAAVVLFVVNKKRESLVIMVDAANTSFRPPMSHRTRNKRPGNPKDGYANREVAICFTDN